MKKMKFIIIICLYILFSCKTRNNAIMESNIQNIYTCYKGERSHEYELNDNTNVKWDKKNLDIKHYLNKNKLNYSKCIKEDSQYLNVFLSSKKLINYLPIKVIPLNEFGYILTKDNKLIYYGIMNNTLIDLSKDKIYIDERF